MQVERSRCSKKGLWVLVLLLLLQASLGLVAQAASQPPELPSGYAEQFAASGAEALEQALPQQTRDFLEQLGIRGVDLYGMLDATPRDIIGLLLGLLQSNLPSALRAGAMALVVLVLLAFVVSAMPPDEKARSAIETTGSLLALTLLLPGLAELLQGATAVVRAGSDFSLLLIPVLAGIISAAGNPALALSYHSITFAAAQGLQQLADGVVIPCTGIVLGLSFVEGAAPNARLGGLAGSIKKTIIGSFAILAGLFSALLSLKSLIANTADALVIRGVKIFTGSVPLVGGALSEACGAILSSVTLLRGAVGGFALFGLLALYAPVLVQLLLWSVLLKLLAAAATLFDQPRSAGVFQSAAYAIAILSACVLFSMALLLISTGLVLTIKNQ